MSANSSRSAAARRMTLMSNAPRFSLGQLVATPGAMELLEQTGFSALALISCHSQGSWGDCCDEDKETNELAIRQGMRVMSVYRLVDAETLLQTPLDKRSSLPTLWIITEADRSVTTLLLPSEY
ncbi:type I restriction endonuclease subunit M [Comamonas sp. wu1-DMT]|uniref:type I restriction endonuclease subunit M n=1 Tax=Comamonas sp. wu1-DMT TaxID=3126390 RepID=UPI0032E4FEFD